LAGEKLGEILIKKGLINHKQLTEALEYQARLNETNYMPLGEIIVKLGYITKEQLLSVLDIQKKINIPPPPPTSTLIPPPPPPKISEKKLTSPLLSVNTKNTKMLNKPTENINKPIGEILIEKGFIQRFQLTKALEYQESLPKTHFKPIGEILIDLNYITRDQLNEALGIQAPKNNNSLGEILKQLGLIDESQLAIVLMQQHSIGDKKVLLGELLVQHGFITKEQLNKALEIQKNNINNSC
jgi:uncharacterized protein (DUF433 family)